MLEYVFLGLIILSTPEGPHALAGVFDTEQECREESEAVLKKDLPIIGYSPCVKLPLQPYTPKEQS